MQLYEKYRPRRLSQIKGQSKAIARIRKLQDLGGLGGRSLWLSGKSGQGKTTMARCVAAEIADEFCIEEFDAGQVGISDIQRIADSWQSYGWGKGGRAYIFNEAHGLRTNVVRALLVMLEQIPDHVVICFTTTTEGQALFADSQMDSSPLMSRCVCLTLQSQGIAPIFARMVSRIASREGLNGRPLKDYQLLAKKTQSNCRAMLQAVGSGAMLPD